MRLRKSFHLALNILFHSKLRSWLTIIGIIIGIASVVSIISMSIGAQEQLEDRLGSLGADILTVSAGMSRAQGGGFGGGSPFPGLSTKTSTTTQKNLTKRDLLAIETIDNVELVMGQVSGTADIVYASKTASDTSCTGVDVLTWKDITTATLSEGRFLISGDTYSVVIGSQMAENMFSKEILLNSKIIINGKNFNVVGILEEGNSVYMPIDVARDVLEGVGSDEFDSISVKISDVTISDDTVELITAKLMLVRGILQESKIDFSVSNPSTMQETMEETMSTMSIFLGAIAAISLLVGAIGIANSMFTSVLEKTRDIGIMKAIGAKNRDILSIFLFNSGLIGLVGGIGGVIVGFFVSQVINTYAGTTTTGGGGMMTSMFGSSSVSMGLVLGALAVSVFIGMISGAIPAIRASRLSPVDALRYE